MLVSQKLAIAAHMHVLLRRKTGRVTDTEWMAENLEYALEIVRFARAKALEDGHADLAEWADKLERAALEPAAAAKVPLVQSAAQLLRTERAERAASAPPVPPVAAPRDGPETLPGALPPEPPAPPVGPRYVGGIR